MRALLYNIVLYGSFEKFFFNEFIPASKYACTNG
jgi:hypothetical protein